MTVAQMASGQGGWPLTIVMTADRLPFFSGTYFPRESRFGRPGMVDLVPRIRELWETRRPELMDAAASIRDRLRHMAAAEQGGRTLDRDTLDAGFRALAAEYDPRHGGFGRAPKFPTPHRLLFLLRWWHETGSDRALEMVEHTLRRMRAGGVYDQVGFGFHRYSTDEEWLVPHFEKMLYDEALLVMAYVEAGIAAASDEHHAVAREVIEYVLRDLTSQSGAFFSAEDADSEGEEGKFYVWSTDELRATLGADAAAIAEGVWGATPEGNFLEESTRELTGTNILHVVRPLSGVAGHLGTDERALGAHLEEIRKQLLNHRAGRVRPLLDDKILTDWNGLMIASLAKAGRALADPVVRRGRAIRCRFPVDDHVAGRAACCIGTGRVRRPSAATSTTTPSSHGERSSCTRPRKTRGTWIVRSSSPTRCSIASATRTPAGCSSARRIGRT